MAWQSFLGQGDLMERVSALNKPFEFDPTQYQNDPAIGLIRSNAYGEGERRKRSNLNEMARAGLLGTSVGLSTLMTGDALTSHDIEQQTAGLFEKRRQEALQLHKEKLAFQRQMEMFRLQQKLSEPGFDWAGLGTAAISAAGLFI